MSTLLSAAFCLLFATVTDIQIREHQRRVKWLASVRLELEADRISIDKRTEEIRLEDERVKKVIESLRRSNRPPALQD